MAKKKKSQLAESIINGSYNTGNTQQNYSVADSIINGTYRPGSVADDIINGTFNLSRYGNQIEEPKIQQVEQTVTQPELNENNSFGFSIDKPYEPTPERQLETVKKYLDNAKQFLGNTSKAGKEEPSTYDKLNYVRENVGTGLTSGLVNILDAPVQYVQEGAEAGKNKSFNQMLFEPDNKYIRGYESLKDENMSDGGKVLDWFLETFTGLGDVKNAITDFGEKLGYSNNETANAIQNVRDTVRKPINEKQQELAEQGEKLGGGWKTAGEVGQAVGNMIPSLAASAITGNPSIGLTVMGTSAKGGSTYEAEQKGASLKEANAIGLAKAGVEVGTEKLTGGLNIFGKGKLDDLAEAGVNKLFKGKVSNFLAKKGLEIAGEEVEEVTSDLVDFAIDKATTDPDATYTMSDLGNTLLTTALTTGTINATTGGYSRSAYQLNTQELQEVLKNDKIQKEVNNKVEQLKTPDMSKEQVEQLKKNVEAIVLGDVQNNINNVIENQLNIIESQNTPQTTTQTPLNEANQEVLQQNNQTPYQTQTPQITPLNEVNQELQQVRQNDIANQVQAMNLEQEPQFIQKQGNYVYEKSDNSKIDNLRKDAATYLKEGEQTTNFVNTLEKLVKDKDIEIRFDPKLGNNVNGTYKNGVITINPNSNRAGEFVAIHELTHAIGTQPMIDMIQKYRKSNAEFNNAVERLLSTYNTTEINEEALGDIAGQLFGNQEYINNLSMENPSLFKKIYNEIKYLWHQFRGYKNQNQFIEDLRNKWESAYRNQKVQQKAKNSNIEMSNQTDSNGNMLSNEQVDYFKNSKVRDENGNLIPVYHGTNYDFTIFKNPSRKFNEYASGKMFENTSISMFTDSQEVAQTYIDNEENQNKKPMKEYLNITNPYIIDAKYQNNKFFYDENGNPTNVNELVKKIYDSGKYDGVIIKNIADLGNYEDYDVTDGRQYATDYIVFNSNQIKNIDNLTPTQDDDIRYSKEEISNKDSQGKELSKQQQKYFKDSKIRNDKGELLEVYHGTNNDFTVFDKSYLGSASGDVGFLGDGFYFATHKGEADYYGGKSMKTYLNVTNPYNIKDLQKYKGMNLRGEDSNPYIEIKNLVDMNPEWKDIKIRYGNTYGDIANATDEILNSISVEDLGETDNGHQYKVNVGNDFDIVNAINNYSIDELKADAFTREMRDKFGFINSSDVIQDITDEARMRKLNNQKPVKTFSEVLEENGYDGIIQGEKASDTDEIVVFNPNQIKNVDNTNPTDDPDIRYSKDNQTWREYLEKEFPSQGTRTNLQDINERNKPLNKEEKTELDGLKAIYDMGLANEEETARYNELERRNKIKETTKALNLEKETKPKYSINENAKDDYVSMKVDKAIQKNAYKNVNTATKTAENYLKFTREQKTDFKDSIKKLSLKTREQLVNGKTYNQIKDLVNNYANVEYNFIDEELKNIKSEIRKTKINIPEEIRNQITDYSDFRKQSKLNISKDGQNIDSIWQELSNDYPHIFDSSIQTEADMLYALSDLMNKDIKVTEKYRIPDSDLQLATKKIYNSLLDNSMSQTELDNIEKDLQLKAERRTRQVVQNELLKQMDITLDDIESGKDIKSVNYQITDPRRVNEKVFSPEVAQKINDATVNFVSEQEAKSNRWKNKERDEIKDLGIKARSKESAAVQKYGEKEWINDKGELLKYGDEQLARDFPNKQTQEKIKNAAKVLREKYDNYIDKINMSLEEMGYDPIPKRKDYFKHFYEIGDKLSQWGVPFNANDMSSDLLPTDINGLTDEFKPGKNWFASAQQRTGKKTVYDAITGIDQYLEGASNLIFHTESIQRYRTLSKFVRETYGQMHGLDNVANLSEEEINKRIQDIQDNKLSGYAAWLDEQANALAGKKGKIDRGVEEFAGRKIYSALNTLKKQVGSNMTGFNVRSAMTNFASAIQGASKVKKTAFLKGTLSTIQNIIHKDGLIDKSNFLTNRFGSDSLSKKAWQKISNAGQIFMTGTDYFTANQIWRSKYFENMSKGMTEKQAIKNADDFAARIMGDRSKGQTAAMFNSKTLGFLTQFQLEVNNQWQSMIHDNKMDIKTGAKSGGAVIFQLGQLAVMSNLFNLMMKGLTGSDVMFDPIDILKDIINPDDDDKDKDITERAREALGKVVDQLPMANIITGGGRIPISEALEGLKTTGKFIIRGKNKYGQKVTLEDVKKDLLESLPYWIMPTGWGQARKTINGVEMYTGDKPVAGSYTDKGNLRFTADTTPLGKTKAALFGAYSSQEAQDYIKGGYETITSGNNLDELKNLGYTSSQYKKYRQELNAAGRKNQDKMDYILSLDIPKKEKDIMASRLLRKEVDTDEIKNFETLADFNKWYKKTYGSQKK